MGRSRKKGNPVNGWLVLDKPEGITSTQALSKARYLLNAKKAGHAGTLDPSATGILPLAFGEGTKTIPYCQDAEKTYQFTVKWGSATNTDDAEGEIIQASEKRPTKDELLKVMQRYVGQIEQVPPQFSAIKIDGQRAYALARKGEEVEISARSVIVYELNLLSFSEDQAMFECQCSKGTYIRSLARDMGEDLGCFGHIIQLRRTAVGLFDEKSAISLDKLEQMLETAPIEDVLLPVEAPLDDIPALVLTDSEAARLKNGQSVALFSKDGQNRLQCAGLDPKTADNTVLVRTVRKPVALAHVKGVEVSPVRILNL